MDKHNEYIERLNRIEKLLWKIDMGLNELERKQTSVFPTYLPPEPDRTWASQNVCLRCGVDFSNMTGYVCTHLDCPSKCVSINNQTTTDDPEGVGHYRG